MSKIQNLLKKVLSRSKSPAPLWWTVTQRVWVYLENIGLGAYLFKHPDKDGSFGVALFKLISSQTKIMVTDLLSSKSIEYAPLGASDALKKVADTDTPKQAIQAINEVISDKSSLTINSASNENNQFKEKRN